MSLPLLTQTYDEVRRLAIAGSQVAPGDFRLQKLVPQLQQAGAKAPVFAKVSEAARGVVESTEKTSAPALLELATLMNAILYTQGETGIDGELAPIKTIELARPKTQASARMLKPLQEALTTTGSGRLEIIREAHERGAFHDLRLLAPALAALDDTFAEIGDLVAREILPLYGLAILPELQAAFNPKGRGGDVRRLELLQRLDRVAARPYVQRALEEGSKEVRVAAIACLGDAPDDLPLLLEHVRSKSKEVRAAALRALGSHSADNAANVLCEAIGGDDFTLAVEPLRASRNSKVTAFLLEAVEKQFSLLCEGKERDAKKLGEQNERLNLLLECLRRRDDKVTEKLLLKMFAQAKKLESRKGEPSGKDVLERLVSVMMTASPKTQSALVDAHASLTPESLGRAFVAACHCRKPAEVFTLFSPYVAAKVNEKKKNEPEFVKREIIVTILSQDPRQYAYDFQEREFLEANLRPQLDPQWLDLAVSLERPDLVQALAVPKHVTANALLAKLFRERLAKAGDDYGPVEVLRTMIRVGHPAATDSAIDLIRARAESKSPYGHYWLGHVLTELPKVEALPKLEALLPTLPEKMIDHLLDAITQLKSQP